MLKRLQPSTWATASPFLQGTLARNWVLLPFRIPCQTLRGVHGMRTFRVTLRGPVVALSFSSTSFHIPQTILDPLALPIPFTATNSFPLLFPISLSPTLRSTFALLFSAQLSSVLSICHRFSSSTHLPPPFLFFFLSFSSFSCFFSHSLLFPSLRTRIWSRAHAALHRNATTPTAAGSSLGRTALEPQLPRRA